MAPRKRATKAAEPLAATISGSLERWLQEALGNGSHGDFGVPVTASTVRGMPAAWYSINKIAGHVGSLPLNLYCRTDEESAEIDRNHPSYWLLRHQPNALMTAAVFRETLQHHALLHGNGRAAIIRDGRGEPKELIILQPSQWAVVVSPPQRYGDVVAPQRKWHVRVDDPTTKIADEDVLHIMGLSDDGMVGLSVIDAAKQALGLAVAQQWRAVKSEKNGARVRFLLSAPAGAFRDAASAQEFIDRFNEFHSGSDNADKTGLLREGITVQNVSQTNVESQLIESRKFSRQDIGLLFMVEQMLGDDSSVSYNSLEQKNRAYLTNCLDRWLTRWQEECAAKMLTTAERNSENWYFRFVTQAMLRGTTLERYQVYQIARQIGILNANEVRELEDINEREDPGGDSYDNPSTTPGGTKQATTADTPDKPGANPGKAGAEKAAAMEDRISKMITARVRHIVDTESSRVMAAVSKADVVFAAWIPEFYATWATRVVDIVNECGGSAALATDWTTESERRLQAVATSTGRAGLHEAVRSELALWHERAAQLATAVISTGG